MDKDLLNAFGKCPYVTVQMLLSGKWSILLLWQLSKVDTLRFGALQRALGSVTQATLLTKQLRALEQYGLITR